MNEDTIAAIIQTAAVLYVVVRIIKSAWIRFKTKQRTGDLAMQAIVEAEKLKWEKETGDQVDR